MTGEYSVSVDEDAEFVVAGEMQSDVSLRLALRFTEDLVDLGDAHAMAKGLIDIRGTRSASSVTDKYRYAYHLAREVGLTPRWRVALLKDGQDSGVDFLETVMRNACYEFRIFTSRRVAAEWLGSKA